jgi:hypothetical protein
MSAALFLYSVRIVHERQPGRRTYDCNCYAVVAADGDAALLKLLNERPHAFHNGLAVETTEHGTGTLSFTTYSYDEAAKERVIAQGRRVTDAERLIAAREVGRI